MQLFVTVSFTTADRIASYTFIRVIPIYCKQKLNMFCQSFGKNDGKIRGTKNCSVYAVLYEIRLFLQSERMFILNLQ